MEQIPQREKVRCCVVFHTPRLRNDEWYNLPMTTPPDNNFTFLTSLADNQQSILKLVDALLDGQKSLTKGQTNLSRQQASLTQAMENLAAIVGDQGELVDGLETKMDGITAKIDGLRDDIGLVKGGHARNAMRQNLARIADEFGFELISEVPQAAVIGFSKVATAQGEAANEAESFRNADLVMNVRDANGQPGYVALDASFTVADNDIRRAVRNAGYLHQYTGTPCYAAVASVEVLPEAQAEIDAGKVLLYRIPARELQSE